MACRTARAPPHLSRLFHEKNPQPDPSDPYAKVVRGNHRRPPRKPRENRREESNNRQPREGSLSSYAYLSSSDFSTVAPVTTSVARMMYLPGGSFKANGKVNVPQRCWINTFFA